MPPSKRLRASRTAIRATWVSLLGLACCLEGCESETDPALAGPALSASARRRPLDHLATGELAPGKVKVFGFVAPREMRLERRFPDAAHLVGSVPPNALSSYVRSRVAVEHVEVGAARTVFPKVVIRGGPEGHVFRIDVVDLGSQTRLIIRDITPPPTTQGLSEAERWKRAGLTPEGELLNAKKRK